LNNDYFRIGIIVNVHGLKGEIKVLPTTDDPNRFDDLVEETIEVFRDSEVRAYTLERARRHKSCVFLKLTDIDDRNAATELVKGEIRVSRSLAIPLEEDEYYHKDLLNMSVSTETGEELGVITDIIQTGANDVYVIDKNILIPAVKEYVLSVSVADARMVVFLPDELRP